jgi:RNA polymerase sigma factor (TIGR02999 family)
MADPQAPEITELLVQWRQGDGAALERLVPIVYAELRRMAARHIRNERALGSLQPTALVHEAYVRLVNVREADWQDRIHFYGAVANIMRRVLVDLSRARRARKRGSGAVRVSLSNADVVAASDPGDLDVWELDDALGELSTFDPELGRLVELRYFAGMTLEETAEIMSQSPATVKRRWQIAKGWLHRRLEKGSAADGRSSGQ